MTNDDSAFFLTVAQVAKGMQLSEQHVRKLIREGQIPAIYAGRRVLILSQDLLRHIAVAAGQGWAIADVNEETAALAGAAEATRRENIATDKRRAEFNDRQASRKQGDGRLAELIRARDEAEAKAATRVYDVEQQKPTVERELEAAHAVRSPAVVR
ncbi:MAG: helix-turn-helix domain-containing protein [Chloroflexi bacterium]|nr:MAG: helix-turn-helix domain-containing protein [Chloroflexota bacterium]